MLRVFAAACLLLVGCSEPASSATPFVPSDSPAEPLAPGVADADHARDLLPQRVDLPWRLVPTDSQPAPAQFDAWARDLQIAVVFEAAVGVAQFDRQNTSAMTVFAAPDQGIDGPAFARSWLDAYACDPPREIALAGVAVTTVRAQGNCRSHYLIVFRDQLVVIEDSPDMTQVPLEARAFEPLVDAIMEQAQ